MVCYLLHKRLKNQNTYSSLLVFKLRETNNGGKKLGRWEARWEGNFKLCVFFLFFYFLGFFQLYEYFAYSNINFRSIFKCQSYTLQSQILAAVITVVVRRRRTRRRERRRRRRNSNLKIPPFCSLSLIPSAQKPPLTPGLLRNLSFSTLV